MVFFARMNRFLYRKLLSLVLCVYFLIILSFLANLDFIASQSETNEEDYFNVPDETSRVWETMATNKPLVPDKETFLKHTFSRKSKKDIQFVETGNAPLKKIKSQLKPIELTAHSTANMTVQKETPADFVFIGEETFARSAFLDDRKESTFVRIITLMSKRASRKHLYCHFLGVKEPLKSEYYELCENHDMMFGGYIFSCRVPQTVTIKDLQSVAISLTETGSRVFVSLLPVRPPEYKLVYLDMHPSSYNATEETRVMSESIQPVPFPKRNLNAPSENINKMISFARTHLKFAICVSPLFGDISVYRLVEFIELSRLLGADHFIFYNHSISPEVSEVLQYYAGKNIATIRSWKLPAGIDKVIWYYGQLLANNDCLYRTMPDFDLVSFNDIDEFIVPHSNASSWKDAFSLFLTDDRCGFSFQSAFYEPGFEKHSEMSLQSPIQTTRSRMFSAVRTKVMLCPWRVFEVGIHHISKQNREEWLPGKVQPEIAYLHHYRHCQTDYGMYCGSWTNDTTIADRYLPDLAKNFKAALRDMSFIKN